MIAGVLTISQQVLAETTAAKFGVSSGRSTPLSTFLKLDELDYTKPQGECWLRELGGYLMRTANAAWAIAMFAITLKGSAFLVRHVGALKYVPTCQRVSRVIAATLYTAVL